MKQIISVLFILSFSWQLNAQGSKYQSAMEPNVAAMDTSIAYASWLELGNNFERIATTEKSQWLPYYYAAVCNVMSGYKLSNSGAPGSNTTQTDQIADKAETLLNKAEEMSKDNSEIYCVRKMIATLRMTADPQSRYQTYGPLAIEALAKAKSLDPKNPRVYFLEGQDKFFTPEQFGGSKTDAKLLFEESLKLFESAKPKTSIDPRWGMHQVKYFLEQIK